jgi:carbon monoxide dehydrogenase subunit G
MILRSEFTVGADADEVWKTLLDMERVATCLPGAVIKPGNSDDTYEGSMKLKIGPMTVTYEGSATFAEIDEAGKRAVISLRAREAKGQGTAMATITNVVESHESGTKVTAETDLHITGPQARFGRGIMEDVAGRVLEQFSTCLEREIAGPPPGEAAAGNGGSTASSSSSAPAADALDVGSLISKSKVGRIGAAVVGSLGVLVLLVRRRRR